MAKVSGLHISRHAETLLYILGYEAERLSYKVYAVGKFVCDALLGKQNWKIDLLLEGDVDRYTRSLQHKLPGKTLCLNTLGSAIISLSNYYTVDIASLVSNYFLYTGAQSPAPQASLRDELFKKDFSINTLAMELNPDNFCHIFDFFGGRNDLAEGTIRVLYSLSFVDEPLRLLRALHLEQKYGFRINMDTYALMHEAIAAKLLRKSSKEGIGREIRLILGEPEAWRTLERLQELGLWRHIFPGLHFSNELVSRLQQLELLRSNWLEHKHSLSYNNFIIVLAGLFYGLSLHEMHNLSHRLRLKRRERIDLIKLLENAGSFTVFQDGTKEEAENRYIAFLQKYLIKEEGATRHDGYI